MRIGITTLGCDAGRSGIGKYVLALLKEMPRLAPDHTFVVAVLENEREIYRSDAKNVEFDILPSPLGGVKESLIWHAQSLPGWVRKQKIDVLFLPAGNRRLPWSCPCPTVGTVHDLSSFHVEAKYDRLRMFYIKQVLPRMIRRLTRVITVSTSSKEDIVRFAHVPSANIAMIANGFDPNTFHINLPKNKETVAKYAGSEDPYWIYVSRIEHPGKNHVMLIDAYETLTASGVPLPRLVCAGGDWDGAEHVHRRLAASVARDRITFTGFVADGDLPKLVAGADACVYPSLYEGFGIPIVEAMACGVPVACSNTSSLPEVAGDAALLFDPNQVTPVADALRKLATDASLRQRLTAAGLRRAAGFTWEACAKDTLREIYSVAKGGAA